MPRRPRFSSVWSFHTAGCGTTPKTAYGWSRVRPDLLGRLFQITHDRQARLADALQRDIRMIPYSAKARYNLQGLFTAIVEACPEGRAWLFSSLKNFTYDDFLTAEARQVIETTCKPTSGVLSLLTQRLGFTSPSTATE